MDTSSVAPPRTCTKCMQSFPATTAFFGKQPNGKYGLSSWCKGCRANYQRGYLKIHANSVQHAEYQRQWRENHPEQLEIDRRRGRIYRANKRATGEDYEYLKVWYQTPNGVAYRHAKSSRRRAREKNNGGTHTAADVRLQIRSQTDKLGRLRCWWCGKPIKDSYHVDHVIPLDKGGGNGAENIVISHALCNLKKGSKLPSEWNGSLF